MKKEFVVAIDFIGDAPGNKEIIRCKDCKHGEPYDDGGVICEAIWHDDDWFCADGERR